MKSGQPVVGNLHDQGLPNKEVGVRALGSVLQESGVKNPVELVFNAPVIADDLHHLLGQALVRISPQRADEIAGFPGGFRLLDVVGLGDGLHYDALIQAGPALELFLVEQAGGKDSNRSFLNPPVCLVEGFGALALPFLQVLVPASLKFGRLQFKKSLDNAVCGFVVGFQGEAIIASLFKDEFPGEFLLGVQGVDRDNASGEIQVPDKIDGLADLVFLFPDEPLERVMPLDTSKALKIYGA